MSSSSYLGDQSIVSGPATRLLFTLLAGIPLGFVYRRFFYGHATTTQHLYFTISGLILFSFNYGLSTVHSMISIVIAYLLCQFAAGTLFSVIFSYVFYLIYLIAGYYYTASDTYDLSWAMPQCVLTLRLVGLIIDIYDGCQSEKTLSSYQKMAAVRDKPGLLEIAAYCYFYGSSFVGPQFPLQRFRKLVNGEYSKPNSRDPPESVGPALGRLLAGLAYASGHVLLHSKWPTEFLFTVEFYSSACWFKMAYILLWFRFIVMRYQAVWLIAESVCILNGLGHSLHPETGEQLWDGVRNIRLTKFELSASFQSIVESFNYNTNQWSFNYLFKRLKFLGNKSLSHILTLSFLALWHGTYSGYFACFAFEYICILTERQFEKYMKRYTLSPMLNTTVTSLFIWFLKKSFVLYSCAFGFLPFALLTYDKWIKIYRHVYFNGWVIYAVGYAWLSHLNRSDNRKKDEPVTVTADQKATKAIDVGEKED